VVFFFFAVFFFAFLLVFLATLSPPYVGGFTGTSEREPNPKLNYTY
jgi:hypothetical protein